LAGPLPDCVVTGAGYFTKLFLKPLFAFVRAKATGDGNKIIGLVIWLAAARR
jgi:hypothetical protein